MALNFTQRLSIYFFQISLLLITITPFALSQPPSPPLAKPPPTPPPPPPPAPPLCNGIFLTYTYSTGKKIPPNETSSQPYRFESTLTVLNNGREELKSWQAFVGFAHGELLVSATNALLADGSSFPANVTNGTVFAGYPMTDLKTAIETAGDLTQMEATVKIVGTQFGVAPPGVPLPSNITLTNDGFICPKATLQGNRTLYTCCTKDPNFKPNVTVDDKFLPRRTGDLTIMYDVTRTFGSSYMAQVEIANHNSLGRLDHWQLSFDWMRDEFIFSMRGAYPYIVDASGCIFGKQANYYESLDFSTVLNCERRPTIVDLPQTKFNDSTLGMIPGCCKNGTILPRSMNPSKSNSVFQMQVFKMPPDTNRSALFVPQNWKINGTLNPDYQCGPPVRVRPSQFRDPSGLPSNTTAVASWQVVCNITQPKDASPRCCVSFSAYFNDSVVPCRTCACGCPSNTARTCSTTAPAILLPPEALLVPFDNRTSLSLAWAEVKHRTVPNPMPCGDNCGVSINWHLATDYRGGWSARVTLFNWDEIDFADWFAAVQMGKATAGFEKMYSMNATLMSATGGVNNTILMQGLEGLNYLVGESDGDPLKKLRVPGKQQSVISFTKKLTPGINIATGDGFPVKMFFNGEECSMPTVIPMSGSDRKSWTIIFSVLVAIVAFILMQQ